MRLLPLILTFLCLCAVGREAFAQLSVAPHADHKNPATNPPPAGAKQPAAVSLNWEKADVVTVNPKRAQVSLNGTWRFMPATEGTPSETGWAYIKVPGSWHNSRGRSADFVAFGQGPLWDRFDGARVSRAWYERQARIPAEWEGRAISLRFDRICTDAIVYVNGKECGKAPWPWGSVDITSAARPGESADIRVLVAAIADADQVGTFWQNALSSTVSFSPASLRSRGLTGSVFLESRSSAARVSDIFVRTSTRKSKIEVDVELTGVNQPGPVHFAADMLNEKGEVEKSFAADAVAAAKETQTLVLSWAWADARLWDVGQPNLYTLRLRANGAGLDDEFTQKFGFREFWIEGRQFYLNGAVIHLRQPCFYNGPRGQVGDIFAEMGGENVDTRGDAADSSRNIEEADRQGYLVAQYILNANKYMMRSRGQLAWEQNQQRAFERADVWMRHYRNHPSVIMWIAGFNFFNSAVDADPRHVGRGGWGQNDQSWQRLISYGKEMFDGLKKLDSTRAYYSHAGAYTGDVYTMNCYLDLLPLQEREDWLSAWAESGEMPVSMVEFGTPMDCTFRRGRHGFESNITSEPLLTEFAAIYFGTEAYRAEEQKYRAYLHDLFRGGMLYASSENRLDEYANNHKIQQLYRIHTWRSWRSAGLSGGLRTWSWMQDALKEINGPTLAWISGPAAAYTSKDHHYSPGQKIEKQIVLINDARQPQNFTAAWTATVGGEKVRQGRMQGRLAVSEIRFIPFQMPLPSSRTIPPSGRAHGEITLAATIGQATHQDSFKFRVFGEEEGRDKRSAQAGARRASDEIALIDPGGLTKKMLDALGYRTTPIHLSNNPSIPPSAAPLVVIGRNALKDDPTIAVSLEPYVRAGGRALICAQDPDWMARALEWRVCPKVARRVFPVRSATLHSPFDTLDSEDLRDWSGSSTLIEAYPEYAGNYLRGNEREQPYAGWHWGNRGGVSSAAIEKPHRSGWRPLLECEFDLAYTPLMELDYGQGRLIVSTLDLEDHIDQDPTARRMAGRLIDYALQSPLSLRVNKVVYVGGATGAAWLDRIGVSYQQSATMPDVGDTAAVGLLLIGPDAAFDPTALTAYLENGGKAFFLPRAQSDGFGAILKPAPADFAGSFSAPEWTETRGLSASDLRWRSFLDTPPWILSSGVEIGADGLIGRKTIGKGLALFCQVDPDGFHADQKTYFRYTRWRATRAVAQLLANLGATFAVDSRIFHPRDITPGLPVAPNGDRPGPQATGPRVDLEMALSPKPEGSESLTYYYPDYRTDFPMGDNPYRYYRW